MILREATDADLETLFEHQAHPEVKALAEHPGRERDAFFLHMKTRVLGFPGNTFKVIEVDGRVAGNVCSWHHDGHLLLGYVLGREWWGKGLASRAVAEFLKLVTERPIFADVAKANRPSQRVLEKNGFQRVAERDDGFDYELR
jgi:RimJ/RimL family protein N-acetyltransferase